MQAVESYRLWPEGPEFESRSPCIAQARIRLATNTLPQTPHRVGALCTRYVFYWVSVPHCSRQNYVNGHILVVSALLQCSWLHVCSQIITFPCIMHHTFNSLFNWFCDVGTSSGELSASDISALPPSHLRCSISESRLPLHRPITRRLILPPGDSFITFPLQCKLLVHWWCGEFFCL